MTELGGGGYSSLDSDLACGMGGVFHFLMGIFCIRIVLWL